MSKNPNFANREVADLILIDYKTKKPFLNLDFANVTSYSGSAESVYATGGQGAPKRVAFTGEREGTVTVETQIMPVKLFQLLSGQDLQKSAKILKREELTATETGLALSAIPVEGSVQVFAADDDCGELIEATAEAQAVTGDAITDGENYIVYYFAQVDNVQCVKFDATHYPKAYEIHGSVPFKSEDDDIVECSLKWYKVSPTTDFELSWQNTGDPVSLSIDFEVMADADGNIFDQIFPNAE